MTLVRWQPFNNSLMGMTHMRQMMNHVLNNPDGLDNENPVSWSPRIDVSENDNKFEVSAELPGLDRDDIKIEVQNNILTISGEKKSVREEDNDDTYLCERAYGRFSRSFELPALVESEGIKAGFKNGVLTLNLPKVEAAKPKQIEVHVD